MGDTREFAGVVFDGEMSGAILPDGSRVRFTRMESRLLRRLAAMPGRILARDHLLGEIGNGGRNSTDRSIDFIVNRIRRKLNDDPRKPIFIATRYGEGYVWQPLRHNGSRLAAKAHVVIGPCLGLDHIGDLKVYATTFATLFRRDFQAHFSEGLQIVLDPDCPPISSFEADQRPKFGVELTFIRNVDNLDCVFRGMRSATGRIFHVSRHKVPTRAAPGGDTGPAVQDLARTLAGKVRRSLAENPDKDLPLAVSMIEAGTTFTGVKGHWSENDAVLRKAVAEDVSDFRARIMLATNIHTKYLQDSVSIFSSNEDPRSEDEDEIEALVTESLPHLGDDPSYVVAAAKLLHFVDRGYHDMAVEIAEEAHARSTALLATLPMIGQLRVFSGRVREGLVAIDQALEQCEPGTQFEAYLSILKCEALAAVNDRVGLDAVLGRVCRQVPQIRTLMQVLFTDADHPSREAQVALVNMAPRQARATLLFFHYVYARLLHVAAHRGNAYRSPVALFSRQFGERIIPDEVRSRLPDGFRFEGP